MLKKILRGMGAAAFAAGIGWAFFGEHPGPPHAEKAGGTALLASAASKSTLLCATLEEWRKADMADQIGAAGAYLAWLMEEGYIDERDFTMGKATALMACIRDGQGELDQGWLNLAPECAVATGLVPLAPNEP